MHLQIDIFDKTGHVIDETVYILSAPTRDWPAVRQILERGFPEAAGRRLRGAVCRDAEHRIAYSGSRFIDCAA